MSRFSLSDFIPPVIPRAIKFIDKKFNFSNKKIHPFDEIPNDIDVALIIDVGANVGDVTMAALKSYPKAHVICFEPVKNTFQHLEKRLKPYTERVTIYNSALSNVNGEAEINITNFNGANSLEPQSLMHSSLNPHVFEVSKEKITLVRLDDFSKNFPKRRVDILKVDVEGHEYDVIKGGQNFIQNNVDMIIIEASLMRDSSWEKQSVIEVFNLLSEMGFRLINIFDLHYAESKDLMCVQMDCVFKHKSMLTDLNILSNRA